MTLAAGQKQLSRDARDFESNRAIADSLAELAAQIDAIRRIFASKPEVTPAETKTSDIVFVDDLTHCMECSWARLEAAAGSRLTADVVTQCSRLLEASLEVLQQVQRLQPVGDQPTDA
jgi:hypothetical protein